MEQSGYYLMNGRGFIEDKLYNIPIEEYNRLYPDRKIENESSLTLKIYLINRYLLYKKLKL